MIDKLIQNGIVDAKDVALVKAWAKESNTNVVFIDATFVLPTSDIDILQNFENQHIPDALFFNIKDIADKNSDLPHMLPPAHVFEAALSNLGISNNDLVILYGQHGMIMGPARVWWMLKGFGHTNTLVLNGGLPAWLGEGLPIESGPQRKTSKKQYSARPFDQDKVINMATLSQSIEIPIIDARPSARFSGASPEPRSGMRSGHIPKSINIPCSHLVNDHGLFKSSENIKQLFSSAGLPLDNSPVIATCGSGITACALALALYSIGHTNVSIYDGSWSEWGLESSQTPIEKSA